MLLFILMRVKKGGLIVMVMIENINFSISNSALVTKVMNHFNCKEDLAKLIIKSAQLNDEENQLIKTLER